MSISTTCAAIAETGKAIPGIKTVFSRPPVKLDTFQLPALIALHGAAIYPDSVLQGDLITEQREYRAQVVVSPEGQGNIETIEAAAETLLSAAAAHYMARPNLGIDWVISQVTGDSGVTELVSFDGLYIGFEIRLTVSETRVRTY